VTAPPRIATPSRYGAVVRRGLDRKTRRTGRDPGRNGISAEHLAEARGASYSGGSDCGRMDRARQVRADHVGNGALQHVDRPKLARAEAEEILQRMLAWADGVNAEPNARVRVKTIDLFGSLQHGAAEVGDIDLFVVFTTMDLAMDLQPEDQDCEDELTAEPVSISGDISPSSELDQICMGVPSSRVFPWRV
jgi:hypothetical protein